MNIEEGGGGDIDDVVGDICVRCVWSISGQRLLYTVCLHILYR